MNIFGFKIIELIKLNGSRILRMAESVSGLKRKQEDQEDTEGPHCHSPADKEDSNVQIERPKKLVKQASPFILIRIKIN